MSQDLFSFPSSSGSVDDPASQPIESSGISGGTETSPPPPAAAVATQVVVNPPGAAVKGPLICGKCGKVYVRKFYYEKHIIAHNISGEC